MKLKLTAALLGAVVLVSAGGCNFMELSLEDALRPPKTMGDEAEIEQLISNSAKGGYTLKYPKNGNYRSAIIMRDLDGDKADEAIAFFHGKDETAKIHMLVMNEADGKWQIAGDYVTETTDVDCVDFSNITESPELEILVGYTTYTPNVNFLSCYTYSNGTTSTIQAGQSYSAFYCGSLDNSGKDGVMTLNLFTADNEAKATLLEYDKEKRMMFAKASVSMDPNVVKFRHVVFGELEDNVKGIVVDGAYASDELVTQVIYFNNDLAVLRNPLYRERYKNPTLRTVSVYSEDVDNDRIIDVPTVEKLPSAGVDSAVKITDKVTRNTFSPAGETLNRKNDYAINFDYGFLVKIPATWQSGTYTAAVENTSMKFYAWQDKKLGSELFEIRSFDASAWDQGKDNDGYTVIYRDNRYAYAFRNETVADSPFYLTDNEIKTAFSVLNPS